MFDIKALSFTASEALAIAGLAQAISLLVYLLLRVQTWRRSLPALACFGVLALCFSLQFSLRLEDMWPHLRLWLWLAWLFVPVLSYLLILQIATARAWVQASQFQRPRWGEWVLLFLPLLSLPVAGVLTADAAACRRWLAVCMDYLDAVAWFGSLLSAGIIGALWLQRGLFDGLRQGVGGRERYWLVLTLVLANIGIGSIMLLRARGGLGLAETDALLAVMGLAALYLASSSLFRVYPAVLDLAAAPRSLRPPAPLSREESALLDRLRALIEEQKLYHEPGCSRASLARELACSESQLSRIVNAGYGKTLPRLLNERRVADAQRMLADPVLAIQVVAFEVGFSALASFNRAFREVTGETPTAFRERLFRK